MDGYTLTENMRRLRRRFRFTAVEQSLFYELVAVCNGEDWRDVFDSSNAELCNVLGITEKTLIKARETLINAGLIYYKSGKSKRSIGLYSFVKEFKTTGIIPVDSIADGIVDSTVDGIANPPDFNIGKTKTETKTRKESKTKVLPKTGAAEAATSERAKLFYASLVPFVEKYPKEMLRDFYNYWSEWNVAKTKMRFELQKTWELPKRLVTWANRTPVKTNNDGTCKREDSSKARELATDAEFEEYARQAFGASTSGH